MVGNRVFSKTVNGFILSLTKTVNGGKKGEIALEADISKSLLFHYFKNKKELYLFLWEEASRVTMEYLKKYQCYEMDMDFFALMRRGLAAKIEVMEKLIANRLEMILSKLLIFGSRHIEKKEMYNNGGRKKTRGYCNKTVGETIWKISWN